MVCVVSVKSAKEKRMLNVNHCIEKQEKNIDNQIDVKN